MEAVSTEHRPDAVEVTLTLVDAEGNAQTESKHIAGGPTKVTQLKAELGVAAKDALWVIEKSRKKKQLGDHETHDVKEDDHYEAIVKGGVS